jgi:hypothetical protein
MMDELQSEERNEPRTCRMGSEEFEFSILSNSPMIIGKKNEM